MLLLHRSRKLEWISRASLALLLARQPCGDAYRRKSRLQVFAAPSSTGRHSPRRRPTGILRCRYSHACELHLHPGSDLHDTVTATLGGAADETSMCASPGLTSLCWVADWAPNSRTSPSVPANASVPQGVPLPDRSAPYRFLNQFPRREGGGLRGLWGSTRGRCYRRLHGRAI